jgi:biopolymer transport protein ExbB/TolQ
MTFSGGLVTTAAGLLVAGLFIVGFAAVTSKTSQPT